MDINRLTQQVHQSLQRSDILSTYGVDCSEVAEYLKKTLKIGTLCTIRAFRQDGVGCTFKVSEPQGVSEDYFYHTVLWVMDRGITYIIDGTGAQKVLTLCDFDNVLCTLNNTRFVYFEGYVSDYSLKNVKQYKQRKLHTI